MKKIRRTQEEWGRIIDDQANSGKSVTDYCNEIGVSESLFYRHRRAVNPMIEKVIVEPKNVTATINGIEVETDYATLRKLLGIPQ